MKCEGIMKLLPVIIITAFVLALSFVVFVRTPILSAQGTQSHDGVEAMARRSPSATRKPTQSQVPTRRPSNTRVPTHKPSHTRVVTKTKTRTIPKPSHTRVVTKTHTRTNTRIPTRTHTPMPTTTPSTVPTATATPTPVALVASDTVEFVNVGSSDWSVSVNSVSVGVEPSLELQKGETYTFTVDAGSFHPLMISTDGTSVNEYTDGVSPTGGSTSSLTFAVPSSAPSLLYYICANHSGMRGSIVVVEP